MLKASSSKRVLQMVFDSIKKDRWNSLFWEREVEGLPQRETKHLGMRKKHLKSHEVN